MKPRPKLYRSIRLSLQRLSGDEHRSHHGVTERIGLGALHLASDSPRSASSVPRVLAASLVVRRGLSMGSAHRGAERFALDRLVLDDDPPLRCELERVRAARLGCLP